MIPLNQARVGTTILFRNEPHEIVAAQHIKMGRGGAKLTTKLRNLLTQAIIDYTFQGDERLDQAEIYFKSGQYLYSDGGQGYFMLNDTYEQVNLALPADRVKFLKEGENVDLVFWSDRVIDVKLPKKIDLKVDYTEPAVKGNTVNAATKAATLETGAKVQVPLFIATGDTIRINTETGTYDSRVSK